MGVDAVRVETPGPDRAGARRRARGRPAVPHRPRRPATRSRTTSPPRSTPAPASRRCPTAPRRQPLIIDPHLTEETSGHGYDDATERGRGQEARRRLVSRPRRPRARSRRSCRWSPPNGLECYWPEGPTFGVDEFKGWYDKVTHLFFDEVHTMKSSRDHAARRPRRTSSSSSTGRPRSGTRLMRRASGWAWTPARPGSSRRVGGRIRAVIQKYVVDGLDLMHGSATL